MPRPSDHTEGPSTLPAPELNPLQNPILGQNMGRWAEVYFTSPPEKREEAVLELLRELETENAPPAANGEPVLEAFTAPQSLAADYPPAGVRCHACGEESPQLQRFCGQCGAQLEHEKIGRTITAEPEGDFDPPRASEFLLFGSGREAGARDNAFDFDPDSATSSAPYRIYIGVALAILTLALAYVAWRGSQAVSSSPHIAPPTGTSPAKEAVPPVSNVGIPSAETKEPTSSSEKPIVRPDGAAKTALPESNRAPKETANDSATSAASVPPDLVPPGPGESNSQSQGMSGNGSEELAIAQGYLSGAKGQSRDSAEAAKWLWKAIAKHNAQATMLLSDLYLRGDGVPKNCDQARVLLDAAAIKGMKDAGERLRHLQAFGCQ